MAIDWRYWAEKARDGQASRAAIGRRIARRSAEAIYRCLESGSDIPFLDPDLVVAALRGCQFVRETLSVYVDRDVAPDPIDNTAFFPLSPTPSTPGKIWRLRRRTNRLYEGFLIDEGGSDVSDIAVKADERLATGLETALERIASVFPDYSALMELTAREFVLFQGDTINSFASENFHGVCFLSLPRHRTLPYFMEDILHQAGHVMMGSMFFDWDDSLTEDRLTPISKYSGVDGDERPIATILHGVFTEMAIAEGLLRAMEQESFSPAEHREASGRLALVLCKYRADIQNLFGIPTLMNDALLLRDQLLAALQDIWGRSINYISNVNLAGQGYNFDLEVFLEANG